MSRHSEGPRAPSGEVVPRRGPFRRLWSASTVSSLGTEVTALAVPLTGVLILHADALEMGLLAAALTAPVLAVGLFCGVLVDRLPKRSLMVSADAGRALLLASIPAAALAGGLTMGQLYIVVMRRALLAAGIP